MNVSKVDFQLQNVFVELAGRRVHVPDLPLITLPIKFDKGALATTTFTKSFVVDDNIKVSIRFDVQSLLRTAQADTCTEPEHISVVLDEAVPPVPPNSSKAKAAGKGFISAAVTDREGTPLDNITLININGGVHVHVHF